MTKAESWERFARDAERILTYAHLRMDELNYPPRPIKTSTTQPTGDSGRTRVTR